MTWTAAIMDDGSLDPDSLVGRMLRCDDVPRVEQEITGDGSGTSLPPFSNQPRVCEPLPLWLAMARAEAMVIGSHASEPNQFSGGTIKRLAPVIEAVANWLLPDSDALPIDELAAAQQHIRHALRVRLTEQVRIARSEP